jgi:hypothetical protein
MAMRTGGYLHLSIYNEITVLFPNDVVYLAHFSAVDFYNRHVEVWFVKKQTLEFRAILQRDKIKESSTTTGNLVPAWSSSTPRQRSPCWFPGVQ